MFGGDQERTSFLVARPSCFDFTRLFGSAAMIEEFFDSVVRSDPKLPRISWRVAANLRRIFHRDERRRTWPKWQFLFFLDGHNGAGVPVSMERENKPIIVVDES